MGGSDDGQWWSGEVSAAAGRWTADHRSIVTDVTLRTDGGERVTYTQEGGHVDGLTMVIVHGPPRVAPGMRVAVHTRSAPDGAWQADTVRVLDGAAAAAPYVRTTNIYGTPIYWGSSCVTMTTAAEGTRAVDAATMHGAIAQARAAWPTAGGACSYLTVEDGGTAADTEIGFDGINLIKFRDDTWSNAADAIAVTKLVFVEDEGDARDGELLDADVEMNNVGFRITVGGVGTGSADCDADLAATLTHELGHVIGFEHSPDTEATMFATQACGETTKLTPEADDVAAMCDVYPLADDPGACRPPESIEGGGCCGAARPTDGGVALLTLLALAVVARRRRARP